MGYEPHILCVLPTAWPLQNAPAAMNATWMLECDRVVFAVSHDQLRVAPASNLANRVSVEPTHARYKKSLGDGNSSVPRSKSPPIITWARWTGC